jgi:hypothetical protein
MKEKKQAVESPHLELGVGLLVVPLDHTDVLALLEHFDGRGV